MNLEMHTTLLNMNNLKLMETILKALRVQLKRMIRWMQLERLQA